MPARMLRPWHENPVYRRDRAAWRRGEDRPRGLVRLIGVFALLTGLLARRWGLPYDPDAWFGAAPPEPWVEPSRALLAVLPLLFGGILAGMMTIVEAFWGRDRELDELFLSRLGGGEIVTAKTAAIVEPLALAFAWVAGLLVLDALLLLGTGRWSGAEAGAAALETAARAGAQVAAMAVAAGVGWIAALRRRDPWVALGFVASHVALVALSLLVLHMLAADALVAAARFLHLHEALPVPYVRRQLAPLAVALVACGAFAALAGPLLRHAGRAFDRDYAAEP